MTGGRGRLPAIIAALGLAAASTGVIIPALRELVEKDGHDRLAAGLFMAAHVIGGALGAALGARAIRFAGSARRLAIVALTASVLVIAAMAAVDSLTVRIGLRFVDGACHLLAITALIAAATSGDAERRAGRAVWTGVTIVLGVASGLGLGTRFGHPETALIVAALLSGLALVDVLALVAAEPPPATAPVRSPERGPIAPGLLSFGERFVFGGLTVAVPFVAPQSRVGLVLAVFMVTSVVALPLARRCAAAWGARRLAVRSMLVFALALATAIFDVLGSIPLALAWAIACGASAGAVYAAALVLAARSNALDERMRDMATLHAAGSAGHALGALCAGALAFALPGMLVVVVPSCVVILATTIGVWITVPQPARPPRRRASLPSARVIGANR